MTLFSRVLQSHHGPEKVSDKPVKGAGHGKLDGERHTEGYSLGISLESPPIMLFGQPHESTGSIVSGILTLDIFSNDDAQQGIRPVASSSSAGQVSGSSSPKETVELDSVVLSLVQTIKYTKPFIIGSSSVSACSDCCVRKNILARWDVLTSNHLFPVGSHAYPFSHLLPGSLPPSCKLGSYLSGSFIKYDLIAVARSVKSGKKKSVKLPLNISRSILRGPDRNSNRVFPPTEMKASTVLSNVIYPKSTFPIELTIDNIVSEGGDRRWRMRRLNWRIDECTKVRAHCCDKHISKLKAVELSQKKLAFAKDIKSANKSNVHHSTIQTGMSLSRAPSLLQSADINGQQEPENRDEENTENTDGESVVANAHNSYVEDFLQPSTSRNSDNVTSGSNNGSSPLTASPRVAPGTNEEALYLEETRSINHGEIKSGWKTDFSGRGKIEIVGEIGASNFSTGMNKHIIKRDSEDPKVDDNQEGLRYDANVSCDITDPSSGIYVNHVLVVEVIVAEELINNEEKKNQKKHEKSQGLTPVESAASTTSQNSLNNTTYVGVPTGAARVLRMQFRLILTERSGLGIAWDDEVPPTYENVQMLSPPNYQESSASIMNTPSEASSPSISLSQSRPTPGVLYGIGETPLMGSLGYGQTPLSTQSIDHVMEPEEVEFRL